MVGIDGDYWHSRLFGKFYGDNTYQLERQRRQGGDYFNGMPEAAVLTQGLTKMTSDTDCLATSIDTMNIKCVGKMKTISKVFLIECADGRD
jgi:hypothetical protein